MLAACAYRPAPPKASSMPPISVTVGVFLATVHPMLKIPIVLNAPMILNCASQDVSLVVLQNINHRS